MAHRWGKDRQVRSLAAQRPYTETQGARDWDWAAPGRTPLRNSRGARLALGEEGGAVTYWLHSQGWPGCSGAEPTLPSEHRVEGVRSEFKTQEQNCSWDASQSRVSQASFPGLGLLTKPSAFPKGVKSPKFSTGWGGGCPVCLDL